MKEGAVNSPTIQKLALLGRDMNIDKALALLLGIVGLKLKQAYLCGEGMGLAFFAVVVGRQVNAVQFGSWSIKCNFYAHVLSDPTQKLLYIY